MRDMNAAPAYGDFDEYVTDVLFVATAAEATGEGEDYPLEAVAGARRIAAALGSVGSLYNPNDYKRSQGLALIGALARLGRLAEEEAYSAGEVLNGVVMGETCPGELERRVYEWTKEIKPRGRGAGILVVEEVLSSLEESGLALSEEELAEIDSELEKNRSLDPLYRLKNLAELHQESQVDPLSVDDLFHIADDLVRMLVDAHIEGRYLRKEEIYNSDFFKELPETTNMSRLDRKDAFDMAWELMVGWFEQEDPEFELLVTEGEARGTRYMLSDPELALGFWANAQAGIEAGVDPKAEEDELKLRGQVVEQEIDVEPLSLDVGAGIIITNGEKIVLSQEEKFVAGLLDDNRRQERGVGFFKDSLAKRFGLTKSEASSIVDSLLAQLGPLVKSRYNKVRNKKVVKLVN